MSGLRRLLILLALSTVGMSTSGLVALIRAEGDFPHADHEGLFPLCSGCHAGIERGAARADWYPQPASCAACHDGQRQDPVEWTGPTREPSNVEFVHPNHVEEVTQAGASATCSTCHQDVAGEGRMSVAPAAAESCLTCHAHEAPEHLAEGRDCATCHIPLARAAGLTVAGIDSIQQPASHERSDFGSRHEPLSELEQTSCATCHARQSCERCHFNGEFLTAVSSLAPDPRVASLVAHLIPEYPEPASHDGSSWQWLHGGAAEEVGANCANCHTRPSCETCHTPGLLALVSALPELAAADPRGVTVSASASLVHPAGFPTAHGAAAATLESSCASCHTESSCTACHEGASSPGFHVGNFLQSHAPEAYGNEVDCASCHNAEVFCRGCHSDVGLAASGAGTAFHDARPLWLLGHGLAARQGLESCTTCHSQSSCLQCHAAVGSWRINPHGPDFDPVRAQDSQNKSTCALCHRTGIPPS